MAAYRPYPHQPSFTPPPSQNPLPPHPPPQRPPVQPRPQFSQGWNFNSGGSSAGKGTSNANANTGSANMSGEASKYTQIHPSYRPYNPPPPPPSVQNFPYQLPPPPPPESSYVPPPHPPPTMQPSQQPPRPKYYPSSQPQQMYSQYNSTQPAEPPPLPPPSSPLPPPPPQSEETSGSDRKAVVDSNRNNARWEREREKVDGGVNSRRLPDVAGRRENSNGNGNVGKMVETEQERRLRKKKEYEKQKMLMTEKEKAHGVSTSGKGLGHGHGHEHGHESVLGSRMGDRRASGTTQLLSSERIENRLKKPTTFLCKMKFRNELPDPSTQLKYMAFKEDPDRFTKYTITSLEKNWKPELHVEPDLGIPLDLLDLSVYNPPKDRPPLAPEDEELLRDDDVVTPVKKDGIRRKARPTDKGVSWLVKTQYISPVSLDSAKQSLTEKQAKELREKKGGQKILDSLNNRERQIKDIEASFMAAKSVPVHATNKNLYPVEVLPLLPDFERYEDQFVVASFDNAPTADLEAYSKLDRSVRDEQGAKAIMKSYVATGADPNKKEQFLAYMVPSADEISKDILDPNEDISYSWVREYNWDVRGDDADDPSTYLVSFGDSEARYVPLPTKLNLRKKRATEGRSTDEIEHFPAPASITVRQRLTVSVIELKDPEVGMSSRRHALSPRLGHSDEEDGLESPRMLVRVGDVDQFSGEEEDYMSE